jgi:RimJ/RimL family protein N-acetyltransferase
MSRVDKRAKGRIMAPTIIPEIETERLLLREPRQGDVDAYAALIAEPDVLRFLPRLRAARTIQERAERTVSLIGAMWETTPPTSIGWFVTLKDGSQLIGRLSAGPNTNGKTERSAAPEVAYVFGKPYWGKGYATEAVRALIRYGFEHTTWPEVVAAIVPGNVASRRVLEHLGFDSEGDVDYYELTGAAATLEMDDPVVPFFSLPCERFDPGDAFYLVRG